MGATAVWNQIRHALTRCHRVAGGYLATGLGDGRARGGAGTGSRRTAALFRLSTDRRAEAGRDPERARSGAGRAITFQQSFGALVRRHRRADHARSSSTGSSPTSRPRSLRTPRSADRTTVTAQRAMQLAGSRAGKRVLGRAISPSFDRLGRRRRRMTIRGFTGPQTASLVGRARRRGTGVRPAWLTQLIDTRDAIGGGDVRGRAHGRDARAGELGRLSRPTTPRGTCSRRARRSTTPPRIRGRRGAGRPGRPATCVVGNPSSPEPVGRACPRRRA